MNSPSSSSSNCMFTDQLDRVVGDFPLLDIDDVWRQGQRQIRIQRFSVGVGMLSLMAVLLVAVVNLAPNTRGASIDAATALQESTAQESTAQESTVQDAASYPDEGGVPGAAPVVDDDAPGPQRGDHWHAAFGISVCGEFLPPLMSQVDADGIHSHQDDLIHIHPFFESSAGQNARMQLFFDNMGMSVSPDEIVLGDRDVLTIPDSCTVESVRMAQWKFSFQDEPTTIIDNNFGDVRFVNDQQVFVLYLGPDDGEITKPPSVATMEEITAEPTVPSVAQPEGGDVFYPPVIEACAAAVPGAVPEEPELLLPGVPLCAGELPDVVEPALPEAG